MLSKWSDSFLPLLAKCLGPAVLARIDHTNVKADSGSAIHRHLELRAEVGYEAAMAGLEQTIAEYGLDEVEASIAAARCRHFTWTPPPGAIAEIALAWDELDDYEVKPIRGGQGKYAVTDYLRAPGTIDIIFSEPEPLILTEGGQPICPKGSVLWVCDYKTGVDTWVDPIETNWQLRSAAIKAAKWTGAREVMPAVIYVGRGEGTWDVASRIWDLDRIERVRKQVFDLHARADTARPENLTLVEGYHCRYCPAATSCPAKMATVTTLLTEPKPIARLDAQRARQLAEVLPLVRDMAAKADETLRQYVRENGPIDMGGGRFWGPVATRRDVLLPKVWVPLLQKALGQFASHAIKIEKAALGRAIAAQHEHMGMKRAKSIAMRSILSEAGKLGGILSEPCEKWILYRKQDEEDNE